MQMEAGPPAALRTKCRLSVGLRYAPASSEAALCAESIVNRARKSEFHFCSGPDRKNRKGSDFARELYKKPQLEPSRIALMFRERKRQRERGSVQFSGNRFP